MVSKGVTRSGEAYCLACHQMVERDADRCPGCLNELTEEVKAFACPKCQTVMALGEPQCPTCGLKFKVKSVRPKDKAQDDQFLIKLIEWGKAPPAQSAGEALSRPATPTGAPAPSTPAGPSPEQVAKLAQLKESIRDLMANRSEMLERMEKRLADEKARLAEISTMEGKSTTAEQVEAEIMSLADEMADITMLQAHMESLSNDISQLLASVDVSEAVKERGLAARALKKKLEAKEREVEELKAKEEQLAKREEMVDRKIQAYAAKKRQLDETEEDLKSRLARLEGERAELEGLKALAAGARSDEERREAQEEWVEEQRRLRDKLLGIRSTITIHRSGKETTEQEIESVEGDLQSLMGSLEQQISSLIMEKIDLQTKMQEAQMMDDDIRKLLKVLDQMLGQLPEDVVDRFSKSDEFALYERVLDRFKI